jgi:CDP-diacylglycerol--glycerol-3-phosphate 3-phosphatidyltransferase
MVITKATWCTLIRLIGSPLILPFILLTTVPSLWWLPHVIGSLIFVMLGFTDFLDGFIARYTHQETALGKMMDPLADKILILVTVIPLVYLHRINLAVALLILAREIIVLSLREIVAHQGKVLPVGLLGKIKTAVQMVYFTCVLLVPPGHVSGIFLFFANAELFLLGATIAITLGSAVSYVQLFLRLIAS